MLRIIFKKPLRWDMSFHRKYLSGGLLRLFPLLLKLFLSLFIAVLVFLSVALVGVRLFGVEVYTMLSSSMEPSYRLGSVVYVKEVDLTSLQPGDVITFDVDGDITVTHRIVGLFPDENDPARLCFQTKGDANEKKDGALVEAESVIGEAVFTIPYLGYFSDFIRSGFGLMICTVLVALVALLMVFVEWWYLCDASEVLAKRSLAKKRK